jgi:hypothetical protein
MMIGIGCCAPACGVGCRLRRQAARRMSCRRRQARSRPESSSPKVCSLRRVRPHSLCPELPPERRRRQLAKQRYRSGTTCRHRPAMRPVRPSQLRQAAFPKRPRLREAERSTGDATGRIACPDSHDEPKQRGRINPKQTQEGCGRLLCQNENPPRRPCALDAVIVEWWKL